MLNLNSESYSASRRHKVTEGINILLSLFSAVGQKRLFPRKIMTKATGIQITVYSVEEILKRFEEVNFKDCRINAYPAFLNEAEEQDNENGINLNLLVPNIFFIDMDLKDFSSKEELNSNLNKISKNISKILPFSGPLVLWSGRGYHIIIPVKANEDLELFEDFNGLTEKPSEELLKFAKSYLSLEKADKANNPAFRSCLLRVPYTFNSKCFSDNIDSEVKIIHEFDNSKSLPKIDNLLVEFMTFLSDRRLKERLEREKQIKLKNKSLSRNMNKPNSIPYVEKLLSIPIRDYRKNAISLILAPYFVNILNLSDEDSFDRIKQWILKCDKIQPLKPPLIDFNNIITTAIKRAKVTKVKPLKFKDTLQFKNKELFRLLSS